MKTENTIDIRNYIYDLPDDRIAKYPLPKRDNSKLLVYKHGEIKESKFSKISTYLPEHSRLVFNTTRVIHARLQFRKETGAIIEIFCLAPHDPIDYQLAFSRPYTCTWRCMVGNMKKWKSGKLKLSTEISGEKILLQAERIALEEKSILIKFSWNNDISFGELLNKLGTIPIPPYLRRSSEEIDNSRYQTVYSKYEGSVAAPTAGLHFTNAVFDTLKSKNISLNDITLHVGAGTFQPVKDENALKHEMHREFFSVSGDLIKALGNENESIISTGTTTLRTLESLYWLGLKSINTNKVHTNLDQWEYLKIKENYSCNRVFQCFSELLEKNGMEEYHAKTQIMIVPGYEFKVANALITNYHQPRSTLLLLVAAFIGDDWKKVYDYSLNHDFRFLSYGDSSLLWKK